MEKKIFDDNVETNKGENNWANPENRDTVPSNRIYICLTQQHHHCMWKQYAHYTIANGKITKLKVAEGRLDEARQNPENERLGRATHRYRSEREN